MKKKVIRTCPACNSIHIVPFVDFETGWQYECKDCGYVGALTAEVELSKKY